ncbi:hypothetical protein F0562_029342 [Nyssa sinensis]|uniref:Uncharacterized protein n=1 Tax=Nyssa sinensis TaxID=561372 RepID=A0A5J5B2Q3_9ASTE|nr:hypothetical protein F0562_029342 [Nyssa sinensis]
MACLLVSISLPIPPCSSKTLIEEIHTRRTALGRLLSPATSRTAMKLTAPNCSNRSIFPINMSCQHRIMRPWRHFYEPVSHCSNVSSSTHTIIYGFWVGPDVEDGSGFVEAFVNQIF